MKGRILKIIISLTLIICIGLLSSACINEEPLPYDAVLFDKAERWAKEEFLNENQTKYPSTDDNLPRERCFIIDSAEEFDKAFDSFPEEVTFTSDILVIYFFTDIYYGFGCKLQAITEASGEIVIDILHEMADERPSTSMPIQRCLVIKLSNCSYKSIQVEMNYA